MAAQTARTEEFPLQSLSPLSVIIPAYNAARDVGSTVRAVHEWLTDRGLEHELIIVDDGSSDDTGAVARGALEACAGRGRVLAHEVNLGKGAAVRTGMLAARGEWALFLDADHSTHISHVELVAKAAGAGADVVIGSRRIQGANIVSTRPAARQWLGDLFPTLTRMIARHGASDSQCGFKAVRRWAIGPVFDDMRTARFAFDVEMLLRSRRAGALVTEIPVRWDNPSQSTLRVLHDGPSMLWDTMRTAWRLRRGGAETRRIARVADLARREASRVEPMVVEIPTRTGARPL